MKKHCVALYGSWVVPLVARTSVGSLLYILLLNTTLNPYLLTGDLRDHSAFGDIVAAAQPLRSRWALEMADRALPGNPWALEMDASALPGSRWALEMAAPPLYSTWTGYIFSFGSLDWFSN